MDVLEVNGHGVWGDNRQNCKVPEAGIERSRPCCFCFAEHAPIIHNEEMKGGGAYGKIYVKVKAVKVLMPKKECCIAD